MLTSSLQPNDGISQVDYCVAGHMVAPKYRLSDISLHSLAACGIPLQDD